MATHESSSRLARRERRSRAFVLPRLLVLFACLAGAACHGSTQASAARTTPTRENVETSSAAVVTSTASSRASAPATPEREAGVNEDVRDRAAPSRTGTPTAVPRDVRAAPGEAPAAPRETRAAPREAQTRVGEGAAHARSSERDSGVEALPGTVIGADAPRPVQVFIPPPANVYETPLPAR